MKKLLSLFAFVAIVFSFAACGGNDGNVPEEVTSFQFLVKTLSTKEYVKITASNPNAYFYAHGYGYEGETVENFRAYTENFLSGVSFQQLLEEGEIFKGSKIFTNPYVLPDIQYVFWACRVEEDPATQEARIVGDIDYVIYKTLPENTLNGEFTVDAYGKKVHFAQGNRYVSSYGTESMFETQTQCFGSKTGSPMDLFTWSGTTAEEAASSSKPFFTLSSNQWLYLFRTRDHAEELFAHATVTNSNGSPVCGLILLPDNWQTPDGIELTTTSQMAGFAWDENEKTYSISENGFAKNNFTLAQWDELELAGAVFLPAAGAGMSDKNTDGWYWTSSRSYNDPDTYAYMFRFQKDNLNLKFMTKYTVRQDGYNLSIRNVRILE